MAGVDADAGRDVLCQMHEAQDLLADILVVMHAYALPGSGRIFDAMDEIDEAMDVLEDILRQMGALE